ncbi:uncharacterized protein LOC117829315 [Notolabrus celidotus]|uniref:uncharacterized protein LOC117829315 n=1 Tax=Notolabrus celidotus TaxID=1203425 RepID=UPI00148FAEC0|nr:uncharacterized protein LOC117829315 [Notolabrus celidotus]
MVRRRPGEAYKPQCFAPTVKFGGGSVMIWGCFSKAGIGQMRLCQGRLNQATYEVILEENWLPSALTMFPNSEDWFFQQDNAPCHTARSIKVWMKDHQIKTLSWPAQSPDLNPIENLWNVIKRKMDGEGATESATTKAVKCFNIFNHDSWPEDQEDLVDHGADDLAFLLDHFSPVLTRNGVNTEFAKEEFVGLKLLIARMFKDKTYLSLWELMLTREPCCSEYKNIMHLVHILLVLPVSSVVYERGRESNQMLEHPFTQTQWKI